MLSDLFRLDLQRLDGDELVNWTRAITAVEYAQKTVRAYGRDLLEARSLDPEIYVITNDGYLMPRDQVETFLMDQAAARSAHQPGRAIPGSAIRPPDSHRHDVVGSDPAARNGSGQSASGDTTRSETDPGS